MNAVEQQYRKVLAAGVKALPEMDPVGRTPDFDVLVGLMRAAQKVYFMSRDREDLATSKQLEKRVDDALKARNSGYQQGSMFR